MAGRQNKNLDFSRFHLQRGLTCTNTHGILKCSHIRNRELPILSQLGYSLTRTWEKRNREPKHRFNACGRIETAAAYPFVGFDEEEDRECGF